MSQSNVVIVGASTAGLFAAYLLAKERIPVQLYEERESLGQPSRTLIVTSKLGEVLGFVPHEAILNKVNRMELLSAHCRSGVGLQEPDLVIERQSLIELLVRKATAEGAKICPGFRFLGFEEEGKKLLLSFEDVAQGSKHTVTTNVLIGADGVLSNVAKAASRDSRDTVTIVQGKVVLPEGDSPHSVKVWFDRGRTEFFYWLIPESDSRGVIGLISRNGKGSRENLEGFLESQRYEPLEIQTAQVPLHYPYQEPSRAVSNSLILLIGDAGGQVKDTTIGGVVAGLRGARAAAEAIVKRVPYQRTLRPLRMELTLHSLMRAVLNRCDDRDYDRVLDLLDSRTQTLLAVHNRDEFKGAFFRLLLNQPRLLLVAAHALIRIEQR